MASKILLLGASGYIGRPLLARLGKTQTTVATYAHHPVPGGIHFDALSMRLADVIEGHANIDMAVILLANVDPDGCWREQEASRALNVTAAKRIIDDLVAWGIKPVFVSSEAVFGGDKQTPYTEDDIPQPMFLYGKQKLEVENYLMEKSEDFLIVRLARVFGFAADDTVGVSDWLKALRDGQPIRCARDQVMSPMARADAVEGFARLLERNASGIYHLAGARPIKRLELLNLFIDTASRRQKIKSQVQECLLSDFEVHEPRPVNSSMSVKKFVAETGALITPYEVLCQRAARWLDHEQP